METIIDNPVHFTDEAIAEVKRLMNEPGFDHLKLLRVGVKGGGCSGMTYILGFDDRDEKDVQYQTNGVPFVINPSHEM